MATPTLTPEQRLASRKGGEALRRAIAWFYDTNPILSFTLARVKHTEHFGIDTIGISDRELVYNPAFIASRTPYDNQFIVTHEAAHVFLGHPIRYASLRLEFEKRYSRKLNDAEWNALHTLCNVSADLALHGIVTKMRNVPLPSAELRNMGCFAGNGKFQHLPEGLSMEQYFWKLYQDELDKQQQKQQQQQQQNNQQQNEDNENEESESDDNDNEGDEGSGESGQQGESERQGGGSGEQEEGESGGDAGEGDSGGGEAEDGSEEGCGGDNGEGEGSEPGDSGSSSGEGHEGAGDGAGDSQGQPGEGKGSGSGVSSDGTNQSGTGEAGSNTDGAGQPGNSAGAGTSEPRKTGLEHIAEGELVSEERSGVGDISPADAENQEELEQLEHKWEDSLAQAVATAKAQGTLPGWLSELVEEVFGKSGIDWRVKLRRFFDKSCRDGWSYRKPSRRHGWRKDVIMPARLGRTSGRGCIIVDTSGSMDKASMDLALVTVSDILKSLPGEPEVNMIQCDTRAIEEGEKLFRKGDFPLRVPHNWLGRGGTNLDPAFNQARSERQQYKWLVVVSDMYWGYQQAPNPGLPTIWLSTTDKCDVPFGECLQIAVNK